MAPAPLNPRSPAPAAPLEGVQEEPTLSGLWRPDGLDGERQHSQMTHLGF